MLEGFGLVNLLREAVKLQIKFRKTVFLPLWRFEAEQISIVLSLLHIP